MSTNETVESESIKTPIKLRIYSGQDQPTSSMIVKEERLDSLINQTNTRQLTGTNNEIDLTKKKRQKRKQGTSLFEPQVYYTCITKYFRFMNSQFRYGTSHARQTSAN